MPLIKRKKTTPISRVLFFACAKLPSFIYATYPPGPDGPSSNVREKNKTLTHSRFTWSYSPQGLSGPTGYPRCRWALTPPFHPYLNCSRRSKSLQHDLSSCSHPHEAPAFHRVRCPLQPGLSSPINRSDGTALFLPAKVMWELLLPVFNLPHDQSDRHHEILWQTSRAQRSGCAHS